MRTLGTDCSVSKISRSNPADFSVSGGTEIGGRQIDRMFGGVLFIYRTGEGLVAAQIGTPQTC